MEEIWKDIPNYEGLYQVSDLGNVRSLDRVVKGKAGCKKRIKGKVLKRNLDKSGYPHVNLSKDSKLKTFTVHQLVCICFLNHKPNGCKMVVDHINEIRTDNRVSNLRIITHQENILKGFRSRKTKHKTEL